MRFLIAIIAVSVWAAVLPLCMDVAKNPETVCLCLSIVFAGAMAGGDPK